MKNVKGKVQEDVRNTVWDDMRFQDHHNRGGYVWVKICAPINEAISGPVRDMIFRKV